MTTINTLVLSGGGMKGVAYCGVFKKLQEIQTSKEPPVNLDIKRIISVSIGTIFGLVYVLGYGHEEITYEVLHKNFSHFKDIKFANLLSKYGLDTGMNIIKWIETLLVKKGIDKDITFAGLYALKPIQYQVLATNLNKNVLHYFDYKSTPELKVTTAIRYSIGIPVIFTAESYCGDIYVDGGLVNNYPINLLDSPEELECAIGVMLSSRIDENHTGHTNTPITDIASYLSNVVSCFVSHRENKTSSQSMYTDRTIVIYTGGWSQTINFNLKEEGKQALIDQGYTSTHLFFQSMEARAKLEKEKMAVNSIDDS